MPLIQLSEHIHNTMKGKHGRNFSEGAQEEHQGNGGGAYLPGAGCNDDPNQYMQTRPKLRGILVGKSVSPDYDAPTSHRSDTTEFGGVYLAGLKNGPAAVETAMLHVKTESDERPSSSHSANTSGGLGSDGSPQVASAAAGANKSQFRGVSYDRKKAKWRVQIKVAALGKSGVSVGYFDTEESAARAYDRAAIGLLGRDNPNLQTNFDLSDYSEESIPLLTGKTREEVKTTLKSERIKQAPRRRFTSRQRTSRFMGVGSSNRKNQWQARILVHGKVTHLGYYETEEEAAEVYDRVSLALHGEHAQTNFPTANYSEDDIAPYRGLDREDLQRALGVKPMDKSSKFRGVSKKKGKWEAKVMVNRKWAYRELFDSEEAAARAYDRALWRLKPREAQSYVNFKDERPLDVDNADMEMQQGNLSEGDGSLYMNETISDDDFEYEYKPTKGTSRSTSMRAKRIGSAPNLSALAKSSPQKSAAKAHRSPQPPARPPAQMPSFVPMAAGGFQFMRAPNPTLNDSVANMESYDEPLLIRVGSETHVLPNEDYNEASALGKRPSRLQRIQSEPQFNVDPRQSGQPISESDLMFPGGVDTIEEMMYEKDLFKGGLDLGDLAGPEHHGLDHELHHINDFVNDSRREPGLQSLSDLMFTDDEIILASLDQARPRKLNKSVSMVNLACQDVTEASNVATRPPCTSYCPHCTVDRIK